MTAQPAVTAVQRLSPAMRERRAPLAPAGRARGGSTRVGGLVLLVVAFLGSLWFANETNSGKFFDRLPYLFDFFIDMKPRDWFEACPRPVRPAVAL